MKCIEVNKNLLSFLDGELNEAKQKATETHIAHCEACQVALQKLKDVYTIIESEKESFKPNTFLAQKNLDRGDKKESSIYNPLLPKRRLKVVTIAAAGIAFGIAIGSLLGSSVSSNSNNDSEQYWSQLADDYFPNEVYSPYDELNNNE